MRVSAFRRLILLHSLAWCAASRSAAAQDSTTTTLAPVRVSVTRDASRSVLELPFAISRVDLDSTRAFTRRASLTEVLFAVPGVSVSNRFNPTQDPRLAIRGFGARSAFGIRGVRILRDGIPLTLADGQTAVDLLDVETVAAAEVLRGSAGALYGNSSGGVVDFHTPAPPRSGVRGAIHAFSADGITRLSAQGGAATPFGRWQGVVTRNRGDGPRDYSAFQTTAGFLDGRFTAAGTHIQTQLTVYDAPRALNPGALTAAELDSTPFAADPASVTKHASKSVRQTLASLTATRRGEHGGISASVFGGTRSLDNPQSFAIVAFDRVSWGASGRGQFVPLQLARRVQLSAGTDLLSQRDDRQNFANCAGLTGPQRPAATCPTVDDRGQRTLDQRERVTSLGFYGQAEAALLPSLRLTGTLRHDRTEFSVLDLRPAGAGATLAPSRVLGAVTPMVGLDWRLSALASLYANYSESFETPTTTELANQPDGSGGLNRDLRPQRGQSVEAGSKGVIAPRLRYDVAVFHITTTDELIPFEIPNSGGRRFYRNAGQTSRTGTEATLSTEVGPVALGATWTALRYVYDDYAVANLRFDGNHVPGVAPQSLAAFANARAPWGLAAVELVHMARTAVNDGNSAFAKASTLVNVRTGLALGGRNGVEPVVGIDNVFDQHYAANIVANAARGRFYEPGAGRTVYVGLRLRGER